MRCSPAGEQPHTSMLLHSVCQRGWRLRSGCIRVSQVVQEIEGSNTLIAAIQNVLTKYDSDKRHDMGAKTMISLIILKALLGNDNIKYIIGSIPIFNI